MPDTEVLIVGAGPTGLVLALALAKLRVRIRIIDKTDGPGTTSRAIVLHARNLEFYRQLGIADAVIERGLKFSQANFWVGGQKMAQVLLGDIGTGLSRFPFVLIFPQDRHEELLVEELAKLGVTVERKMELLSFEQTAGGTVRAELKSPDGATQTCEARFLAGCDGARSTVRHILGTGFTGGTYADVFYVADADATGAQIDGQTHIALDDADFLVMFPMKGQGNVRFVGAARSESGNPADDPKWEDVSKRIIDHLKIDVARVRWFSAYHVHHRVASSFRTDNAFLLGDAAHVHSPVGGQGMNTGLGDAINLAWKLAAVLRGGIDPAVLDTYESERIPFANRLVNTTDRAFQFVTSRGPVASRVRTTVIPMILPLLLKIQVARRFIFRTLSQTAIRYPESHLSEGAAGRVKGGDRLPWVAFDDASGARIDNYAALASRAWQVHCYGRADPAFVAACAVRGMEFHTFRWRATMKDAGLKRDAIYLIRPDGYVGLAHPTSDPSALNRYLESNGIQPASIP